jgi:PiT family inorganic phosphate transporter
MASAWIFTLPSAGLVGAAAEAIAHGIGGTTGIIVDLVILLAIVATIYLRSRGSKVDPNNISDEWTGPVTPAATEPAAA